jgi:hypothetical protein
MTSTSDPHYDQGFYDAIKFVSQHLRVAADRVEQPTHQTVEGKDHKTYTAIKLQGRPFYATKLRELADELERLITQ